VAEPTSSPAPVIPQLIVGLGNPGDKYDRTRHNVGFDAVDELARRWGIALTDNRKFQGFYGEGRAPHGDKIRLLKPQTFMNLSGQSIRATTDWYKLSPSGVLIIYDDMDLPLGRLRLRLSGSAGGHNGMKSAIAHLGTEAFPRLRLGIGNPRAKSDTGTISHVLGQFSKAEAHLVSQILELAVDVIDHSLKQGIEKAMSLYNNRTVTLQQE